MDSEIATGLPVSGGKREEGFEYVEMKPRLGAIDQVQVLIEVLFHRVSVGVVVRQRAGPADRVFVAGALAGVHDRLLFGACLTGAFIANEESVADLADH
jgi:hypothetical protein